jgi:hypothetical protein
MMILSKGFLFEKPKYACKTDRLANGGSVKERYGVPEKGKERQIVLINLELARIIVSFPF